MAQTAAHLVDHVIPPVPVRQWVISVPKRLRCFLADRPSAVAALTRIFIEEIERLLCTAAASTRDGDRPCPARPRLGAVSFLHRFGSAINHHVHLHECATDGVFVPTGDGPPALLRASRLPKCHWPTYPCRIGTQLCSDFCGPQQLGHAGFE
ncbi:MAG: transposase [Pirellulales bacterium]